MAISSTPRFGLKQFSTGADPHPTRLEHNTMIGLIEANAALFSQGTLTARPTAGKLGRIYWATDAKRSYYDDGQAWAEISPIGGGGAGKALVVGGQSSEGTSDRAARADHTHAVPLATSTVDGAMSKADKAKLDAATTSATANTIAVRDGAGAVNVATPTGAAHATTKAYVDGRIQEAATYAEELVDEIPFASATDYGHMTSADKIKLDAATSENTPGTLIQRASNGQVAFPNPSSASHAANKGYVDAEVAKRALAAHTHSAVDLPVATSTGAGTMSAADKAKLDAATHLPTGGTLALRAASGAIHVVTGTAAADAANKGYVDGEVAKKANTSHTHAATDLTSGTVPVARLPLATASANGAMSKADKAKLDAAESAGKVSTIIMRDSAGRARVVDPAAASDIATKNYVDVADAKKANTSHTHAATDLTSGTVPVARLPLATTSANGAMSAADKAKLDNATNVGTASRLILRDTAGRARVADPYNVADIATKGYVDNLTMGVRANHTVHQFGTAVVGGTRPSGTPIKHWAGYVILENGAGGDTRTTAYATNSEGYGGLWWGYNGVPTWDGIYTIQMINRATGDSASSIALIDINATRVKFRARRLSNANWANAYGSFIAYLDIWGW